MAQEALINVAEYAARVCGMAPVKPDAVETLRAEYEAAEAVYQKAKDDAEPYMRAVDFARDAARRLELEMLRSEGRGHTLHASWLEAFLERRHEDCERIVRSEEYRRELMARGH